jgi:hypothetical protein
MVDLDTFEMGRYNGRLTLRRSCRMSEARRRVFAAECGIVSDIPNYEQYDTMSDRLE